MGCRIKRNSSLTGIVNRYLYPYLNEGIYWKQAAGLRKTVREAYISERGSNLGGASTSLCEKLLRKFLGQTGGINK
jgi:hypothetical protein